MPWERQSLTFEVNTVPYFDGWYSHLKSSQRFLEAFHSYTRAWSVDIHIPQDAPVYKHIPISMFSTRIPKSVSIQTRMLDERISPAQTRSRAHILWRRTQHFMNRKPQISHLLKPASLWHFTSSRGVLFDWLEDPIKEHGVTDRFPDLMGCKRPRPFHNNVI